MKRFLQSVLLVAALFALWWWDAGTPLLQALAVAMAALLAIGLLLGPDPEPPAPACPRCGGETARLRVPLLAALAMEALVLGPGLVLMLAVLATGFYLGIPDGWLGAAVGAAFVAYAGAMTLMRRWLRATDSARVYRCARCRHRFEGTPRSVPPAAATAAAPRSTATNPSPGE